MNIGQKVVVSQYRQIAIDIAKNIANGKYTQGQKLFGRSVLASHYKVSPETIRKAVHLLKDMGIVESEKGSGIEIVSVEKAEKFITSYGEVENFTAIKIEIEQWAREQVTQTTSILSKIQYLINEMERTSTVNPLNPFHVKITPDCVVIGKTIDELRFWHNTGGTIVAIRRGNDFILSPGPYASFLTDDIFLFIGDQSSYTAAMKLLFG